jgi:hypothetical protein
MEEAPENGKELSHSAHANGMNEWMNECIFTFHCEHIMGVVERIPEDLLTFYTHGAV